MWWVCVCLPQRTNMSCCKCILPNPYLSQGKALQSLVIIFNFKLEGAFYYKPFFHIWSVSLLMGSIKILFPLRTILHKSLGMYLSFPIVSTIWASLRTNIPCKPTGVNSLESCSTMACVGHQQVAPFCTYVGSRNSREWSRLWKLTLLGVSRSCFNYLPWIKKSHPILPYIGVFTTYPLILSLHQRWISYHRLVIG